MQEKSVNDSGETAESWRECQGIMLTNKDRFCFCLLLTFILHIMIPYLCNQLALLNIIESRRFSLTTDS